MSTPDTPASPHPDRLRHDTSVWSDTDFHLFNEGTHYTLYEHLGAHLRTVDGKEGTHFSTWAPNARLVSVVGDFNGWDARSHPMTRRGASGVWEAFIPGVRAGALYKYAVHTHQGRGDKADPLAFASQVPPATASVVADLTYTWRDATWMKQRKERPPLQAPISIYEVHLGSWMRVPEEGNRSLTYRELATRLVEYVKHMGFTHVELLPITEHPFYGSWGYQATGYFAPTSRYGSPQDLMLLIDSLHQAGIGVILDWVPSHFPTDGHALAYFDGTHLFEHADPRQGFHPDWKSFIFNYGRHEVRSFLISSALFWLEQYHVDGLRVDAVASMLYLDYSRREGEWIPNKFGGRENLESIDFLKRLNEEVHRRHPDVITIAEESTSWPMVSRPTYTGGLGFDFKWDMGWMHDTLEYMKHDPIHRRFHHNKLTFRMLYASHENFVLPLSHDEVVHGKGSLLGRMPGDDWQRRANERLLLGYMYGQLGKKLLFMGGEFGQWHEWNHDSSLDWHLTHNAGHAGIQRWVKELNDRYRTMPQLHQGDCEPQGFEWVDCSDADNSVVAFMRRGHDNRPPVVAVANFTPVPRHNYRIGVPEFGVWKEILNSDATEYGGSGMGNMGRVEATPLPFHGRPASINLTLPPLAILFLELEEARELPKPEPIEAPVQNGEVKAAAA